MYHGAHEDHLFVDERGPTRPPRNYQKPTHVLRVVCARSAAQEFATTKLTTRQTYTLAFVEGNLDPNPITFKAGGVLHECT